jgi:hypothetical protein
MNQKEKEPEMSIVISEKDALNDIQVNDGHQGVAQT